MSIIIFIQALTTLFISGGLFFKGRSLKNRSIAIYFLLFSIEILYFLYGTSNIPQLYPQFYGRFYFSIGLLYGPLLWLHFKAVIDHKTHLALKDLWHFLPVLLLNLYMIDLVLMSGAERFAYYRTPENFSNRIIYINVVRALHQIAYAIVLFRIMRYSRHRVNLNEKFYLGGMSIIYIITTAVITLLTLFASGWKDFAWYYLVCTTFIFIIGYILYKDPKFFRVIKEKYQNSSLTKEDMVLIKTNIEKLISNEQLYLNNELSIEELSKRLDVKTHYISQTFTNIFQENFNDYINRFRIEHAKTLLTDTDYQNYKIEGIALDSGFNNKVTFYKAFSKFANTTPSQYRKNNSSKE